MKLNTDNEDTMPVTWAVYHPGRKNVPAKPYEPPSGQPLWRKVDIRVLNQLARTGKETKRFAARRRQEGS